MADRVGQPPAAAYDLLMLDLDGVVYVGQHALDGVPERIAQARDGGLHVAFVTNNASRTPETVAAHLVELGIEARSDDVVTSAQAAAHLLAGRLAPGAPVFLLGADGLEQALAAEGLRPVTSLEDRPEAVVTGYGPDVPWRRVMQGAMLIRDGLPWVASNADLTIPTSYGLGPGHGVQVRMLADFSGVQPTVAGKPQRPLLDETVRRVGGRRPLMVGDRVDTDIEGAHNAGLDSLLVMTGVTGAAELAAIPPALRPTFVGADLGALFEPLAEAIEDGHAVVVGPWRAEITDAAVVVERTSGSADAHAWWRAVAEAAWRHLDATGRVADTSALTPPGPRPGEEAAEYGVAHE